MWGIDLEALKTQILGSLGRIITVVLILVLTVFIAKLVKRLITRSFDRAKHHVKVDATQHAFLKHFLTGIIYIIGFSIAVYIIPSLRALSVSMLAGAGVLALIIGFASQHAFSNIVSGIFIVIFKPFRVGDRIKIGQDIMGIVEDINLRHTVIKNFENKRIVIPNSIVGNDTIENSNLEDDKICRWVDIGISYDSDIDKAMKIMQKEAMKHPDYIDNRTEEDIKNKEPPVNVRVIGFGDSSVNLRAWVWTKDPSSAFRLGTDLNRLIKLRFDKEGIEIPYPYRTIVYKDKRKK